MFKLEFFLGYTDQTAYTVYGHPVIAKVETYSASAHMLEHIRSTFNGNSEDFQKLILARQGGAAIIGVHGDSQRYPYRWSPEDYALFVDARFEKYAAYMELYARKVEQYGRADYGEPEPMQPVQKPIYFDMESKSWQVEPWFVPAMATRPTTAEPKGGKQ